MELKPVGVLKALLVGQRVVLDGRPCVLEDGSLRVVATRRFDGAAQEVPRFLKMTLDGFPAACDRLPDGEAFVPGTQAVLTDEARSKLCRAEG
ncbi:MAG: hypothetical protein AB1816_00640 [Bacillota bacterium]